MDIYALFSFHRLLEVAQRQPSAGGVLGMWIQDSSQYVLGQHWLSEEEPVT